ncbi:hypothetical protein L6452_39754 [Arctium lappa]|uniref:Uncharacterized protein n=1 Tax=Arctium lappa TaxID=4217 RepID=A0ACB8XT56_ARCLA|nr:hypothetical protein L6452_39754 [Arctium lappa]
MRVFLAKERGTEGHMKEYPKVLEEAPEPVNIYKGGIRKEKVTYAEAEDAKSVEDWGVEESKFDNMNKNGTEMEAAEVQSETTRRDDDKMSDDSPAMNGVDESLKEEGDKATKAINDTTVGSTHEYEILKEEGVNSDIGVMHEESVINVDPMLSGQFGDRMDK